LKIGLGTAQFGSHYGVSNTSGAPSQPEIKEIMAVAIRNDITLIDTAPAYGESESRIGIAIQGNGEFRVVTKVPAINAGKIDAATVKNLRISLEASLRHLKQNQVYGLLVHRVADLFLPGADRLIDELQRLAEEEQVCKIGVSVYSAEEIERVLDIFEPGIMQLPVNVFDQRLVKSGHLQKLKSEGIEIHARSVFLQGLMLMDPGKLPDYFQPIKRQLESYRDFLVQHNVNLIEGALAFHAQLPELDVTLVGVNSASELLQIIDALRTASSLSLDLSAFAVADEKMTNPSLWRH